MRHRYLNVILTINAVLLAALVWTQLAPVSGLGNAAHAAPQGIPNAGQQRLEMIQALEAIEKRFDEVATLLEEGKLDVRLVADEDE